MGGKKKPKPNINQLNTALALIQQRATACFQVLPPTSHGTSRFLNCKQRAASARLN